MIPALLTETATKFPDVEFSESRGDTIASVEREQVVEFLTAVRDAGYQMFMDLCAVDYLSRNPRFEVVINVLAPSVPARLRVHIGIPGEDPVMATITDVYPGANFYEREAWDLFGITFDGHPDLSRILLPDEWEGHPLRKNAPVGSIPVQFKEANKVQ